MIHFLSDRSKNSFIPVNCGAIPTELFENELFGHKKGAYTNAESTETGLIAEADKGILFLDEIESLPQLMQVKLLRFLEEKKYKPLGQSNYITSNVRIIAAVKENLRNKVKSNQFREDLFYRLNVLNIKLPSLKERKEDIPILVSHFINLFSKLHNKKKIGVKPLAMMKMLHYNWDGNIRELQNVIQKAVIMNVTGWIEEDNLDINKIIIKNLIRLFHSKMRNKI
jgi:DNA-binding NtrC family response regulator